MSLDKVAALTLEFAGLTSAAQFASKLSCVCGKFK